MKIKFLQDFQGVETGGVFYKLGQIVDLDYGVASRLVADKRAVLVEEKHYGGQAVEELRRDDEIYPIVELPQPTIKKRGKK